VPVRAVTVAADKEGHIQVAVSVFSPAAPCVQPIRLDVCIIAALLACHTHIGDVAVRDGAGAVRHYARPRWWDRLRRDRNRISITVAHLRGKVETAVSCESEGIRAVVLQRDGRTRCEAIQVPPRV
jgi:hypothetical protein